uniref:Related to Ubl-specific protease n=1 Tax=Neurospora crassa TaxID=5141 RepID=Q9HE82_NEUCS|nr:related to Ubl-specific protease [Neurospora crassa]
MVRIRFSRRSRGCTSFNTFHNIATPVSPPLPVETPLFDARREQEGVRFAHELYIAIRNQHFMRDCHCPVPTIYTSKEAALAATGHIRFYIADENPSKLSVLQQPADPHWHCVCRDSDNYWPVYQELLSRQHEPRLNDNGKRVAEVGELELISENVEHKAVERVLPAAVDDSVSSSPVVIKDRREKMSRDADQVSHPQTPEQEPAPSSETPMESSWMNPFALATRALITMATPFTAVRNFISGFFPGETHYDIVDTRKVDDANGTVSVKRLKRHCTPSTDAYSNELPGFSWADDAISYVGRDALDHIGNVFHHRIDLISRSLVTYSHSLEDIRRNFDPNKGEDLQLNIAMHKLMTDTPSIGPVLPTDSTKKREWRYKEARKLYLDGACTAYELMQDIYIQHNLDAYRVLFPKPPRTIAYGEDTKPEKNTRSLHEKARVAAEFISWVLRNHMHGMEGFEEALSKVFVDANAIHKREIIPSYIKPTENESSSIPGTFPTGPDAAFEDVPIDDLSFAYRWEFKYPSSDEEDTERASINAKEFRPVLEPKSILKKPKKWPTPESPTKYVATPNRKKRLDFVAPVASYAPPKEVPVQVMSLKDAINVQWHHPTESYVHDRENSANRNAEPTTRDLHRFAKVDKSRSFTVSDMTRWTEKEVERDDAEMGLRVHETKYGPFLSEIRQEMLENFQASGAQEHPKPELGIEDRKQILQRMRRERNEKTAQGARGEKKSILDRFFRKAEQEDIGATEGAVSGPSRIESNPSVEQASATSQVQQSAADDDLAIATKKLEDLEVSRQLAHEWENGIRRDIEERHREAERLHKEAERKRREEQRRQEQESRRRREEEDQASRTGLRVPKRPLIGSLSNDWEKKVSNVLYANSSAELAKMLDGQPLTKRDFVEKLLEPQAWLNDNVIIGSISHIANAVNKSAGAKDSDPKCAAFTSYFWPRLVDAGPSQCGRLMRRAGVRKNNFFDIDTILIPICDGAHWTLAVVRPGKRTVAHLDSMRAGAGDKEIKEKLLEWVRVTLEDKWVASEWSAIDYEAPRQTNGYDCGVFTITNALCIALGLNPKKSYTAGQLTLQRRRLAAVLLNGGFTDDFSLDGF